MANNRSVGDKKIIMLNQLPSSKDCMEDSIIKVRVIRLWENHILDKPEQLILMDMGNMVHGSILKKFIYKFERYLAENACYIIKNVSVGDYGTKYKYVDNDKKVNLFLKSIVTPCEDFGGDLHGFKFQSILILLTWLLNRTPLLVNMIGVVAKYESIEDKIKSNGVETKMMYLTLKGLRYLGSLPSESSSSSRVSALTIRVPFREEILNSTNFCHIIELEEFYKVIICGKILPMSKYMQWHYVGCKFRVKYICNQKCNGAIVEAVSRYRINLAVQDATGVVDLSLWERHANKLLKISAYDLLLKLINGPLNPGLFPEELKNLENKLFTFKISQQESDSTAVDASVGTFSVKDVISVTDYNLKAVEKSTTKTIASNNEKISPTFSTPTLKRNLIDVYDVDDPPTQSTTKSHLVA
ncbi:uncharacterized protein LOC143572392, partial [Bidens hawaiensis]|uniref:uncharacterized protein LOC143572392 n=1 Tax=Bidens hawaiensis TaxID=980011 RepID=UPI00404B0D93